MRFRESATEALESPVKADGYRTSRIEASETSRENWVVVTPFRKRIPRIQQPETDSF
jgi:hypothetical protein